MKLNLQVTRLQDGAKVPVHVVAAGKLDFQQTASMGWQMNEPMERSWVTPLNEEDREYFSYFRTVCKRYNINPSRATRLEYNFVTRVAESEFYLQKAAT